MRVVTPLAWMLLAGAAGLCGCAQFGSSSGIAGLGRPASQTEAKAPASIPSASPATSAVSQNATPAEHHEAAKPSGWGLFNVLAPTRIPPVTNEEPPTPPSEFTTTADVQLSPAAAPTKEELLAKLKSRSDVDASEYDRWEKIVRSTPDNDWPLVAIQLQAVLNYKTYQAMQRERERSQQPAIPQAAPATAESPPPPQPAAAQPEPPSPPAETKPQAEPAAKSEPPPQAETKPESSPAAETLADSSTPADAKPSADQQASAAPADNAAPSETSPSSSDSTPPGTIVAQPASATKAASEPLNWREHLNLAIAALEGELAEARQSEAASSSPPELPRTFRQGQQERARKEAYLRLLYLAAQRHADAVRGVEAFSPAEQEFWKHQLHGLGVFLDEQGAPLPDRRARLALRELNQGLYHLASVSGLDVRNLAFCTQVFNFGSYTEFSPYEFRPNQEVLLYAEIENFVTEARPDGFETEMQGSYQIFDAAGQRVAEHVFPAEKELCRNRRRDYFVPFRMYMPKRIAPGPYTLQLTVEDLKGRRFGQASIRFTIVP